MKWKIKEYPKIKYYNEFLIFPRKFNGWRYWLCWVTIKQVYLGWRYSRGEICSIGRNAKELEALIK